MELTEIDIKQRTIFVLDFLELVLIIRYRIGQKVSS